MSYGEKKQKSFLQSFVWIGVFLICLGGVFLAIALVLQFAALSPDNMSYYVNGVRQETNENTVSLFRRVFLLAFSIPALIIMLPGVVIIVRGYIQKARNRRLKEEGERLIAVAAQRVAVPVRVNGRVLERLSCTYTDPYGKTYIFKSGALRSDPYPYLNSNQVIVYHDRFDMGKYFVDIDESTGLGDRVFEL